MNCFVCNAALPDGTGKIIAVGYSDAPSDRTVLARTQRWVRTCDNCERASGMGGRSWCRHVRVMYAKKASESAHHAPVLIEN